MDLHHDVTFTDWFIFRTFSFHTSLSCTICTSAVQLTFGSMSISMSPHWRNSRVCRIVFFIKRSSHTKVLSCGVSQTRTIEVDSGMFLSQTIVVQSEDHLHTYKRTWALYTKFAFKRSQTSLMCTKQCILTIIKRNKVSAGWTQEKGNSWLSTHKYYYYP